jgi:hypothetical protein
MSRRRKIFVAVGFGAIVASIGLAPVTAKALSLTWDVDPAASSIQLTVPDQAVYVTNNNIGNVTIRMRDASNDNQWTDAGGRRAYIDGTITTRYADTTSITFLSGSNNLYALEQVSLRPNPADWNAVTLSYANTRTALAGLGARVRGTVTIILPITLDIAFLALRDIRFDVGGGTLPITGGAFPGGQTQFGISSAIGDVDGLEILTFGQPVPDLWREPMSPIVSINNSGGTVQNLGGRNRKLTYNISMPISIDLQGTILNGTAAGQIVAYATLPEPPPLRIARSTNATVVVAWPATVTGFVLEKNPTLGTTTWATVTNLPVTVGTEKQVSLPASGSGTFYRLRSQ